MCEFPYTKVRNIPNTSDDKKPEGYTSWKQYWEDKTGKEFSTCSEKNCTQSAEHGAHVKLAVAGSYTEAVELTRRFGNSECIVPLCAEHNNVNNTDEFFVKAEELVKID